MNEKIKFIGIGFIIGVLLSLVLAGLFFNRQRFSGPGELDYRYAEERGRTTEIIERLERELERERELNQRLREHNSRARELTGELADAAERNVRNLQDAVVLIREIREKLKVLEDFYTDSGPGNDGLGDMAGD
jgi:hypothetical protein